MSPVETQLLLSCLCIHSSHIWYDLGHSAMYNPTNNNLLRGKQKFNFFNLKFTASHYLIAKQF